MNYALDLPTTDRRYAAYSKLLEALGALNALRSVEATRSLSIAITKLEEALMWLEHGS